MIANSIAPVIIIGMHRSGTSLLTGMLGECGVFFGAQQDEYNEALKFQELNEKIFAYAGASWDSPVGVRALLATEKGVSQAKDLIQPLLNDSFFDSYFGNNNFAEREKNWGWKDPRNTYTLPLWLDMFPEARVVHIIRNGMDVAESLWKRETTRPEGKSHHHYSDCCQSREGCFALWEEYVTTARVGAGLHEKTLEIKFEALLAEPSAVLSKVVEFIGISDPVDFQKPLGLIKKRDGSHLQDPLSESFRLLVKSNNLLNQLYD